MIRAVGQRAAYNPDEFAALWDLRRAADDALVTAIDGLRAHGYPWEFLAELSGVTRQGLAQWRARRDEPDRNDLLRDEAMP